jgi:thiol-disulfide isomerase/thioredoxin
MVTRRAVLVGVIAATGVVPAGCGRSSGRPAVPTPGGGFAAGAPVEETFPPDRRTAPVSLPGELLDGEGFDLAGWTGRVVVLNWWGSWCAPCRREAKDLQAAYQATRDLGVEFLGVNIRDDRDRATAFVTDFGLTYPHLFDPAGRIALRFAEVPPNVVPTTLLLDRAHRPTVVFRRVVEQAELEAAARALAAEAKP